MVWRWGALTISYNSIVISDARPYFRRLIEEPERVEQTILQRSNINTLLTVITTADSKLLASILGPLQKLLLSSIPITRALSSDMRFLRTIVEQVQGEETVHSALTQLHLLKILLFVWRFHARPAELAGMFREAVVPLVEGASSVLVQEMASRIMEEMADCEKDPAGHKGKEHGAALMKGTA